jgi:hypothetical protein
VDYDTVKRVLAALERVRYVIGGAAAPQRRFDLRDGD